MRPHLCFKCLLESITVMVKCGLLSLTPTPLLPDLYALLQVPPAPLHAYPPSWLIAALFLTTLPSIPSLQHQRVSLMPAPECSPHASTRESSSRHWRYRHLSVVSFSRILRSDLGNVFTVPPASLYSEKPSISSSVLWSIPLLRHFYFGKHSLIPHHVKPLSVYSLAHLDPQLQRFKLINKHVLREMNMITSVQNLISTLYLTILLNSWSSCSIRLSGFHVGKRFWST